MALKKHTSDAGKIEPGMNVEATQSDLGEADVSKPKVTDVALDDQGNVGKLVVEKGVIFKKKLEIPAQSPFPFCLQVPLTPLPGHSAGRARSQSPGRMRVSISF
jgi:hypothetical protein